MLYSISNAVFLGPRAQTGRRATPPEVFKLSSLGRRRAGPLSALAQLLGPWTTQEAAWDRSLHFKPHTVSYFPHFKWSCVTLKKKKKDERRTFNTNCLHLPNSFSAPCFTNDSPATNKVHLLTITCMFCFCKFIWEGFLMFGVLHVV